MRNSIKTGLGFGLTSAIITTLGLMVGVYAGTKSRLAVIGSILTIAIADAFSDALGIHISEESKNQISTKEIWEATFSTFFSKLIFALTFIVPILIFPLNIAIIISAGWGIILLGTFSYYIGKNQDVSTWTVVLEHLLIGVSVIFLTHYTGSWVRNYFL